MELTERKFVIRPAETGEEGVLYTLIRELAEYERKNLKTLPLREENLKKFKNFYKVEFAESEGQVVGYALYVFSFSSNQGYPVLYLDDLYVKEAFRGRGIGKALIGKLAQHALDNDCCRMEWQVFSWNEEAISFYDRIGAEINKAVLPVRFEKRALQKFLG